MFPLTWLNIFYLALNISNLYTVYYEYSAYFIEFDSIYSLSYRVKVACQVVDPAVEAAQARLDAMRHGKFTRLYLKKKKPVIKELDESLGMFLLITEADFEIMFDTEYS